MANENELSSEQALALLLSNPTKWLELCLAASNLYLEQPEDFDDEDEYFEPATPDEFEAAAPFHGLKLTEVYSIGGGEGEGENVEVVFAVVPEGAKVTRYPEGATVEGAVAYIRMSGYYYSDEGTTWDDEHQLVQPHEVTVIRFK